MLSLVSSRLCAQKIASQLKEEHLRCSLLEDVLVNRRLVAAAQSL